MAVLDADESNGLALREYLRIVWRWKWLVVGITLVAAVAAYVYSSSKTPLYQSSAQLMYEQPISIQDPLLGQVSLDPTQLQIELDSVGSILASPDMQRRADALIGQTSSWYSVSAAAVASTTSANTGGYSNLVEVSAISPSPALAAKAANAYSDAYIAWRLQREKESIQKAEKVLQAQLNTYGANSVSADAQLLQSRLHDLQILEGTATGDFRVIVPAVASGAPFSPRPMRSGLMGFGVGLVASVGLAFLLEQFNTKLRGHKEVAEALHMPVVGRIPRISRETLSRGALVAITDPDGAAAEALRVLRSNLDFFSVDQEMRSVMVMSSLKGEGKTLTICNLAVTLAMAGKKVVLVDADLRQPRVHQAFGLPNDVGLSTVITGQAKLVEALQPYALGGDGSGNGSRPKLVTFGQTGASRLYLLTSGPLPPNPGEMVASERFEAILQELRDSSIDYVLVDSPAFMLVGDASALADKVDGLLMLVNIEHSSRPILDEAREFIEPLPCRKLGIIAVSERFRQENYYYYRGRANR